LGIARLAKLAPPICYWEAIDAGLCGRYVAAFAADSHGSSAIASSCIRAPRARVCVRSRLPARIMRGAGAGGRDVFAGDSGVGG
jgi:hypothetical protein